MKLFHRDILATLAGYSRDYRRMCMLYPDIFTIRCGFKCRDFSIYHDNIYIDNNPNYYIGGIFYEIIRRGGNITIMKNIYKCIHNNCYRSDDILWYSESGIRITKKYNYLVNSYFNYKYDISIYNLYHGYITINGIVIYNIEIYKMIQNAHRLYKLHYDKIIKRLFIDNVIRIVHKHDTYYIITK